MSEFGIPTLHSRVESWDCDFNDHWNARFYGRSFQLALETIPTLPGVTDLGEAPPLTRYIRFHRELFVGAAVEVRSARLADGAHAGAILHRLSSLGQLAAMALDIGGIAVRGLLPDVPASAARLALPRGLAGRDDARWDSERGATLAETGPIRPWELDHRGRLLFEELVRRVALASHFHVGQLGFTDELRRETGISRMAVETRVTQISDAAAGTPVRIRSRVSQVGAKFFTVTHSVETHAGQKLAFVEHSMVTVDLNARRAIPVPEFLRRLEL